MTGVSSGGSPNMRCADRGHSLPSIGEPTAESCVSPGSSQARSEASRAAACYADDAKPESEVESSAGRSTKMLPAMSTMGGRGGYFGSHPASSNGSRPARSAGSLSHHRPASPSPRIRGGGNYRKLHGGDGASSSVTRRLEKGPGSLATRADFMKPSTTPRNIREQEPRHPSVLDRRGATNGWRFPKVSEKEDEVEDQKDWQIDTVSSHISSARDWNFESDDASEGSNHSAVFMKASAIPRNINKQTPKQHPSLLDMRVEGGNQVPPRFVPKAAPARLMHQASSSDDHRQRVDAIDSVSEGSFPKVSEKKDEADDQKYCQTDMVSSCTSSDNFRRSDSNHQCVGALDVILPEGCILNWGSLKQSSSAASRSMSSVGTAGAGKKEEYITTLGAGGGYGFPHPPPFFKCEVCKKRAASDRLKCCHLVVCDSCGCNCDPEEAVEDEKLLSAKDNEQFGRESLPKVKLQGSDLFLWQQCSFPARLMLCMAKRTGNHLEYYFAPVEGLMNPKVTKIRATVYDFGQKDKDVTTLKQQLVSMVD